MAARPYQHARRGEPPVISPREAIDYFAGWLREQTTVRRAGKRTFIVTVNTQGQITAIEGQDPPRRLA